MGGHSIFHYIRNQFPETVQTWVAMALLQIPEVWQSFQDATFAQQVHLVLEPDPYLWTPGRLALLALDINNFDPKLKVSDGSITDSVLLRKARQALDSFSQPVDISLTALEKLKQAGLVALYLNDWHQKTENWENILADIVKRKAGSIVEWKLVFACIYSLAADKEDVLNAMFQSTSTFDSYDLALGAFLSLPAPIEDQLKTLSSLMQNEKNCIRPEWVQEWLSNKHPELAGHFARWMLEQDKNPSGGNFLGQVGALLAEIKTLSWQAYLFRQSNAQMEALELLEQARKQSNWLVAELISSWASNAEQLAPGMSTPVAISEAWELAIHSAPVSEEDRMHVPYFFDYIQSQLRKGVLPDVFLNMEAWQEQGFDGALLFELARYKSKSGKTSEAISLASQALARVLEENSASGGEEKLVKVLLDGSTLFLELNMPENSVKACLRVLSETPLNYTALHNLGLAYQKLGEHQKALETLEAAFLLAPRDLHAHRLLATALENCQDWETALIEREQISKNILNTTPLEYKEDLHKLAHCAYHAGALQQSLEACTLSLELDGADWQAHFIMGKVFNELGDSDQAILHLTQAVQACPQQIEPWLLIASIYERNNNVEKALSTLNTAIQANPTSPDLHLTLGKSLIAQNSLTQGLEAFQCSYDLAMKQPDVYKNVIWESGTHLSSVLCNLGHLEKSRAVIEPIYQECPENPATARTYARVLSSLQDYEAAVAPLEFCLKTQPSDPELNLEFGKVLLALHREPEMALKALQNTLETWPGHLEAQAMVAEATAATGEHTRALDMFRSALESELGKDSQWQSRLSMGLGLSALALGRNETALAALQEAIQLDPQNATAQQALAEAFMIVGLYNEGWVTAQTTLRLDPGPETTLWFSNLALSWCTNDFSKSKTLPRAQAINAAVHLRPDIILQEAATALRQACKLYPADSRLLVKLSQVLVQAGDFRAAKSSLRDITNLPAPTLEALECSASMLLELKDPSAAAECLEKAIKISSDDSPDQIAERYSKLANAREQAGHVAPAIQSLELALLAVPDHFEYYQRLVNLWAAIGNIDRALETIERARKTIKEPKVLAELLVSSSKLCRKAGRLIASLNYAEQAMHSFAELSPSCQASSILDKTSAQFAEISWILLRPEEAYHSLRGTAGANQNSPKNHTTNHLDYYCLGAELALQFYEEVEAANYLTHALDMAPEHPWPLAIQARLLYKQKDQPLAVNTLLDAVEHARHEKLPVLALISIANAAAEIYEWQLALEILRQATVMAPDEPLIQLSLAQVLVLRGEFYNLCEDLDAFKHSPGEAAFSLASQEEYLNALQSAETALLQAFQERSTIYTSPGDEKPDEAAPWSKAFSQIARWKCRGAAIFGILGEKSKVPGNWCSWNGFPLTVADEAAHLAFMRRESVPEKTSRALVATAREYAVMHPQDSAIQLQCSLALASINLGEALRYARSACNILTSLPKHPVTALSHVLAAHLAIRNGDIAGATQSIQISLGIWTEEARWHNLAARIYMAGLQHKAAAGMDVGDDLERATAHLEEAVRLEPERGSHAILLSQLIFQTASQDPTAIKRAVRLLEKTSRVASNEPEIWVALSSAYQQMGGRTNLKLAYASAERAISVAKEGNNRQVLIEAHVQLGQMALSNGEAEEAYRQARQALRIDAHNADATLLQVHALEALNRTEDALDVIEKALPGTQDNIFLQIKRGALLCQGSDPDTGLSMLESLANQYSEQPAVHSALAKNLYRIGRKEDAIQHAQQAIQLSNTSDTPLEVRELGEMHTLLGSLYNDLGHLDQAIYQFNSALQQYPVQIEAYLALAETYQKQRQFIKAQEVLDQAILTAPTDPRPYYQAGMAYKDGRNYEAAANMLRKAVQLSPGDINIRKQLAAVMAIVVLNNTRNIGNRAADEVR